MGLLWSCCSEQLEPDPEPSGELNAESTQEYEPTATFSFPRPAKPRAVENVETPRQPVVNIVNNLPRPRPAPSLPSSEVEVENEIGPFLPVLSRHPAIPLYPQLKIFDLKESDPEYQMVKNLMKHVKNRTIIKISRIKNPRLKELYRQNKAKTSYIYGNCTEKWMFHGTKTENIISIASHNLKLCINSVSQRKVFFSRFAQYCSFFCRDALFLFRVQIGNFYVLEGKLASRTQTCPKGYDTSGRANETVVVKYEEHTYCPHYVILLSPWKPDVSGT